MAASNSEYHKHLSTGDVLIREGDPGACAYVVEHGKLEVSSRRGDERVVLAKVGVGGMVGEMALISGRAHSATVVALEPTRLIRIDRVALEERLGEADPLLRHLLHVVITRFRDVLQAVNSPGLVGSADFGLPGGEADTGVRGRTLAHLQIERQVEKALGSGELELHYQPIISLATQTVAGFEALIRWRKPGHDILIPPNQFIPVIENSPLILRVGHWIFDICTEDLRRMQRVADRHQPDAPLLMMSINLSARQCGDPDLFSKIRHALDRHGMVPAQIQLEIAESHILANWDIVVDLLNRARRMGLNVAIDGFGAGHSTLAYLHRLPVTTIKLDRSFARDVASSAPARAVVGSLLRLCAELSVRVVAEGAESREQARTLLAAGVDLVQGFYFGRPMARREALELIQNQAGRARSQSEALHAAG